MAANNRIGSKRLVVGAHYGLRDWLARTAIEAIYAAGEEPVSPVLRAAARGAEVEIVADARELAAVAPIGGVP